METDADLARRRRPWLRLIGGQNVDDPGGAGGGASDDCADTGERRFHVLFQLPEPMHGPWGDAFRGDYSLAAIVEILSAFDKNGARLRCLFLEDRLGGDLPAIEEAFEQLTHPGEKRWQAVYAVNPMYFAAAKDLHHAAGDLSSPEMFKPDPDQVVEGSINAMGAVLRQGFDTSIVLTILLAGPSLETVAGALEEIKRRRAIDPDSVNTHQRFCCGAVVAMLEDELAMGGRFVRCVEMDP